AAATILILAAGCGGDAVPDTSPFRGKLDAALAISDSHAKNGALAKVALEAAADGETAVVKKALSKISDSFTKNSTASVCAITLAGAGKSVEATEVAKSITDSFTRDSTLSKIASAKASK